MTDFFYNEMDTLMVDKAELAKLKQEYPFQNPLVKPTQIRINRKIVASVGSIDKNLTDAQTGEIHKIRGHAKYIEVDSRKFVQVFKDGVKELYELSRPGFKVFSLILEHYEAQTQLQNVKWSDSVMLYLDRKNGQVNQLPMGMSYPSYYRGINELLLKNFIRVKTHNVYWINPHLFFIGDKVQFIKAFKIKNESEISKESIGLLEAGE